MVITCTSVATNVDRETKMKEEETSGTWLSKLKNKITTSVLYLKTKLVPVKTSLISKIPEIKETTKPTTKPTTIFAATKDVKEDLALPEWTTLLLPDVEDFLARERSIASKVHKEEELRDIDLQLAHYYSNLVSHLRDNYPKELSDELIFSLRNFKAYTLQRFILLYQIYQQQNLSVTDTTAKC